MSINKSFPIAVHLPANSKVPCIQIGKNFFSHFIWDGVYSLVDKLCFFKAWLTCIQALVTGLFSL
ncbi:hypothetical protein GZ78_29290 [Endozoicomonas numazuensis]|uniref:Uncharacterized protein n=1 Tax=Endozoicomonas numazuensis TaxID=1137799 RepID=A0A081MYE2_9GAMM|nr:hypothetical protein GZ78_29290 [Endozoicomonas numazuensis]